MEDNSDPAGLSSALWRATPCLFAALASFLLSSPDAAAQGAEAKLTDPNTTFHRLYVLGAFNDKSDELNTLDDWKEVKGDLEQPINERHPDLGYVNQAAGSTSRTLNQPTRWQLRDELKRLKELAQPGEEVTFYFAGHGGGGPEYGLLNSLPGAGEKYDEYIWLNDANGDKVPDGIESVSDDELAEMLEGFRDGVTLVVLMDACFAGGFTGAPGDIQESRTIAVIGSSTICPTDTAHGTGVEVFGVELLSGNTFGVRFTTAFFSGFGATVTTLSESFADGAGERKADANGDGVVTANELKDWLNGKGWELGPPDDSCVPKGCKKPKSGGSRCVGPAGPCDLPSLAIDPEGSRMGFLPVRGDGFPQHSRIDLDLVTSDGSRVSSASSVTDVSGAFRGHLPVAGVTSGTYLLTAMTSDGFSDDLFLRIVDGGLDNPVAVGGPFSVTMGSHILPDPTVLNVADLDRFAVQLLAQWFAAYLRLQLRTTGVDRQVGPGGSIIFDTAREADRADPAVLLVSLGRSTGEAFRAYVLGDAPVSIEGTAMLKPVDASPAEVAQLEQKMRSAGATVTTVEGFCFEFDKQVPEPGTAYVFAPPAEQKRFEPLARVMEAGKRVLDADGLTPDTQLDTYYPAITQWAIWTREKGFDMEAFGEAWMGHVRKNAEQSGQAFTAELARIVQERVPGRWRDIQKILEETDRIAGDR